MDLTDFERMVDEALDLLPEWIAERLDNVAVLVEEEAPSDDPNLLGLYEGIPLTARGQDYFGVLPDRIRLFRTSIQAEAQATGDDVRDIIADTVVHEVAHFFGISDERLHELGWD